MKKIFGLFVFGILASAAFANDICLKTDGCQINTDTGICIECIDLNEFFSSRPPPPSCIEDFVICDVRWPKSVVCKSALKECKVISDVRLRLKWKKKSS
jgi:hypothetical protein